MVKINIEIFGLHIKFEMFCNCKKHEETPTIEENAEEHEVSEVMDETPSNEEAYNYFDESNIALLAKQYEKELDTNGLYDIPYTSDIPPKYQIQDDVEIITDRFEKEVEDIIEGRR